MMISCNQINKLHLQQWCSVRISILGEVRFLWPFCALIRLQVSADHADPFIDLQLHFNAVIPINAAFAIAHI